MHMLWEISYRDLDLHCLCAAERGGIHKGATTLLGGLCMTQFLFRHNLLRLHIFYKPSHPGMRFWQRLWRCLSSGDSTQNAGRCGSVVGDRGTVHVHVELALAWDGHHCRLMVCWVFLWVSVSFLLLQTRLEATAYYHYYHNYYYHYLPSCVFHRMSLRHSQVPGCKNCLFQNSHIFTPTTNVSSPPTKSLSSSSSSSSMTWPGIETSRLQIKFMSMAAQLEELMQVCRW